MFFRIWRFGGTILPTRFMVKTYWAMVQSFRVCELKSGRALNRFTRTCWAMALGELRAGPRRGPRWTGDYRRSGHEWVGCGCGVGGGRRATWCRSNSRPATAFSPAAAGPRRSLTTSRCGCRGHCGTPKNLDCVLVANLLPYSCGLSSHSGYKRLSFGLPGQWTCQSGGSGLSAGLVSSIDRGCAVRRVRGRDGSWRPLGPITPDCTGAPAPFRYLSWTLRMDKGLLWLATESA